MLQAEQSIERALHAALLLLQLVGRTSHAVESGAPADLDPVEICLGTLKCKSLRVP